MRNWNLLENYGYVMDDLPHDLFCKLKQECELTNKARYLQDNDRDPMISGLTTQGVPKHFWVKETAEELKMFAAGMFNFYNDAFNYMTQYKLLSHKIPVTTTNPWINIQEKGEYIPNHTHDGIAAYVVWVNIPYDVEEEIEYGKQYNKEPSTSCFEFTYPTITGNVTNKKLKVGKDWEGKIIMFPSMLQHCVYPFYTSDENRISVSGMITFDTSTINLN